MSMGPAYGTEKYKQQVVTITTALRDVPLVLLPQALMLYITDTSYSRAAICEAEKILKNKQQPKPSDQVPVVTDKSSSQTSSASTQATDAMVRRGSMMNFAFRRLW